MRYGSSVRRRRSGCPTPEVSASAAGCIRPDLSGRRHAHQAGKGPTQRAQPRWGGSGSRRRAPGALQEVARGPVPGEDCWGGAASVARLAHGRGGATPRGSVRVPGWNRVPGATGCVRMGAPLRAGRAPLLERGGRATLGREPRGLGAVAVPGRLVAERGSGRPREAAECWRVADGRGFHVEQGGATPWGAGRAR